MSDDDFHGPVHAYARVRANLFVNRVLFVGLIFALWDWWSALLVLIVAMIVSKHMTKVIYDAAIEDMKRDGIN